MSWLYVLTLALYTLWVNRDLPRPWWLIAAAPFAFWLFLGGLALPLLAGLRGAGLLRAAPLLLGSALYWSHFVRRPRRARAANPGQARRLRVMTANLLDSNRRCEEIVACIRREGADLIALQELHPQHVAALQRDLAVEYPYQWFLPGPELPTPGRSEGMGLLSRLPFQRVGIVAADPLANPCQVISWSLGQESVGVIHMHPRIPWPRFCAWLGLSLPCSLDDSERLRDVEALLGAGKMVQADAILLGDMNATDQCRPYRLLSKEWHSAFAAVGHGLGMTYPVDAEFFGWRFPWPLFRLDHILVRGRLSPLEAHVGDMPGSDHRYLVAELALPCK